MCIGTGGRQSTSTNLPSVAPAPTRPSVVAAGTKDPLTLAAESAATLRKRLGVFGNLRTTPMGDASYGSSTFATFTPGAAG